MPDQPTRRDLLKTAVLATTAAAVGGLPPPSSAPGATPKAAEDPTVHLWYAHPSTKWVEALPLGNGRLSAMVHGAVADERIELNDNTLYSGEPGRRDLPSLDITKDLDSVVQQLRAG